MSLTPTQSSPDTPSVGAAESGPLPGGAAIVAVVIERARDLIDDLDQALRAS